VDKHIPQQGCIWSKAPSRAPTDRERCSVTMAGKQPAARLAWVRERQGAADPGGDLQLTGVRLRTICGQSPSPGSRSEESEPASQLLKSCPPRPSRWPGIGVGGAVNRVVRSCMLDRRAQLALREREEKAASRHAVAVPASLDMAPADGGHVEPHDRSLRQVGDASKGRAMEGKIEQRRGASRRHAMGERAEEADAGRHIELRPGKSAPLLEGRRGRFVVHRSSPIGGR